MVDSNDVFLRELKQELEREKFEQIWQRYGVYIIAGVVAILIGVASFQLWRAYNVTASQEAGAQYQVALEKALESKPEEAATVFEKIVETGPEGYATLSELQLAAVHLEQGRKDEALAAYEKLANDSGADALLRDFARLQAAAIQLGTADWTEMQNRLTDLKSDESAWRHSARELLGLAALGAGKTQEARELFEKIIADPEAPQSVQERARIRMEAIVADDLKAAPQAAAETPKGEGAESAEKTDDAKAAAGGETASPAGGVAK